MWNGVYSHPSASIDGASNLHAFTHDGIPASNHNARSGQSRGMAVASSLTTLRPKRTR